MERIMNPNDIRRHHVLTAAKEFLSQNGLLSEIPVPIEEICESKLGIFIQLIPGIKRILGIDAFISSDFTRITIDESCYSQFYKRTRFSIAHEVGHKILHSDWYHSHGPKNIEEALSFQEQLDDQTYKLMEIQANSFAGHVLVPAKLLHREVRKIVGEEANLPLIPPPAMQVLVENFNVSSDVLLRRLIEENIVQDPSIPF